MRSLQRTDLVLELTKKHILLASFGIYAYVSGLKKVVFFVFGHNNPKATVCLDRLLVYWDLKYIRESGHTYKLNLSFTLPFSGFHDLNLAFTQLKGYQACIFKAISALYNLLHGNKILILNQPLIESKE